MKTNLSSQISLHRVSPRYYRPENAFEKSVLTRLEKIPTDIYESVEEGANYIAREIAQTIREKQKAGRFCVLALPGGDSPSHVYTELIRMHKEEGLSFRNVIVFNMYEYYPLAPDAINSNFNALKSMLLDHIDIDKQNIFTPDGSIAKDTIFEYCRLYEQRIESFGGIDIALLGIGRVGNIAFNEPGSRLNSTTRLILLDNASRNEASKIFGTLDNTPISSITMGVATILGAKKVYLLAWGENKAAMIKECVEGPITDTIPASYLQTHNNAHVALDLSAAMNLTRIQRPWLVTSCEWNDKLIRSAIVWLCQLTGKPILKLTNKDYNENGLSELLALYGSAYNVNIKIFNDLQHTITGWPGGKPNADDTYRPERAKPYPKRVVIFSPHPDDDVISMGGTLRRLVEQKHEVHVAYETSGNIAVGDEEVVRFMHFINGFNQLFNNSEDLVINEKYIEIRNFLKEKKDGDMDSRDILTIKGLIRRGEARTACTYNNIPLERCHFQRDRKRILQGRSGLFRLQPLRALEQFREGIQIFALCIPRDILFRGKVDVHPLLNDNIGNPQNEQSCRVRRVQRAPGDFFVPLYQRVHDGFRVGFDVGNVGVCSTLRCQRYSPPIRGPAGPAFRPLQT